MIPVPAVPARSTSTATVSSPEAVAAAPSLPEIHVAVGVLTRADGNVLVAQRPTDKPQGGAWEFPGGKIAAVETPLAGLTRELHEELGIRVTLARHMMRYSHDYPDKRVHLYVWKVLRWAGVPQGVEGQPLAWVAVDELLAHGLLPADRQIVELLQAPVAVNATPIESCWRSAEEKQSADR